MDTAAPDLIAGRWSIDTAHSEITFTIRHLMTTVRGSFQEFQGELLVAEDPMRSSVRVEIAMASIDTRNDERDAHVRSAEILDVARYPAMTFVGTGVERATIGRRARSPRYHLDGDLTIRDVTRPVELRFEFNGGAKDPFGNDRIGFSVRGEINRKDFGIVTELPMDGGGVVVGEKVTLELDVEFTRAGN